MAEPHNTTFRHFETDDDYALMRTIVEDSTAADGAPDSPTEADVRRWCRPTDRFDPHTDIAFALAGGATTEMGFTRVSWYTGKDSIRLYVVVCYLLPAYRGKDIMSPMIRNAERRLQEIAAGHQGVLTRAFQAWATPVQEEWLAALADEGYAIVRTFHNMLRPLDNLPSICPIPDGLEVRPVQDKHFRAIWEAQREVQLELFEISGEHWLDAHYEAWRSDASHTPELWQVAWDGDQVAGMVLPRIPKGEEKGTGQKRGYTEHVFVRKPWRQRGLAKALVVRCLHGLKASGCTETELGVDAENESGAFGFYSRLGFETFSEDLWLRKPMGTEL